MNLNVYPKSLKKNFNPCKHNFKQKNNEPYKISFYENKYKGNAEKEHFYACHKAAIYGIQNWVTRHIQAIEEMIESENDFEKKQNLMEMKQANENIVSGAPANLREACQWIIWYHLASRTYNRDGAGGQIDTLLQPYYEKDIANGLIDKETAVYYLACFLINDPIYWQLGGPDEEGKDQTSEISFLILEAADKINTSLNITIRVHPDSDKNLMRKSLEYLVKNKNGWPRYSGDKALVEGFMKNGFDASLARKRIAVGCNWMSLPGLEYTMNDLVKVNMAKVFEVALSKCVGIMLPKCILLNYCMKYIRSIWKLPFIRQQKGFVSIWNIRNTTSPN